MTQESSPSPNRRAFLQGSAAAAGGLLAAGSLARRVHAAGNDQIRVGLVGCGGRGSGAAINAMNADPGVRIVALADLFDYALDSCRQRLAKSRPEQFQVEDDHCFLGFDCHEKLLQTEIDVVLLCSPPHYRPAQMQAAVAAGKHIFCEKPVATDAAGVRRVIDACKDAQAKDLNVVSGLCWRYDAGVRATMDQIFDGAIGEVVSTQANYLTSPVWIRPRKPGESDMEYQCRNWYYFNWLSGDHYVEQFIHSLDKAMWLRHDTPPVRAVGLGGRQLRSDLTQGDIYDHFAVIYEWADGSRTHAYTRQMRNCKNETEDYIFGTKGAARVLAHEIQGPQAWTYPDKKNKVNMYDQEHIELFEAVRGKRATINNGDYMTKSTLMAILGREVCYSGQELTWDQVATSPQDLRPPQYAWGDAPEVVVPQPGTYRMPLAPKNAEAV